MQEGMQDAFTAGLQQESIRPTCGLAQTCLLIMAHQGALTVEVYDEAMCPHRPVQIGGGLLECTQQGHCAAQLCHFPVGDWVKAPVPESTAQQTHTF